MNTPIIWLWFLIPPNYIFRNSWCVPIPWSLCWVSPTLIPCDAREREHCVLNSILCSRDAVRGASVSPRLSSGPWSWHWTKTYGHRESSVRFSRLFLSVILRELFYVTACNPRPSLMAMKTFLSDVLEPVKWHWLPLIMCFGSVHLANCLSSEISQNSRLKYSDGDVYSYLLFYCSWDYCR